MNWELILGVCGVVIAVCALGISVYEAHSARRHNKMSVLPHIVGNEWINFRDGKYRYEIRNNGIGPARSTTFRVLVDGNEIERTEQGKIQRALSILFPSTAYSSTQTDLGWRYVLAAGESVTIVDLQLGDTVEKKEELLRTAGTRDRPRELLWGEVQIQLQRVTI